MADAVTVFQRLSHRVQRLDRYYLAAQQAEDAYYAHVAKPRHRKKKAAELWRASRKLWLRYRLAVKKPLPK